MKFLLSSLFITLLSLQTCFVQSAYSEETATDPSVEASWLGSLNTHIFSALFFDISMGSIRVPNQAKDGTPVLDPSGRPTYKTISVPFLIIFLVCGGIFFTFWFRWINIRGFKHAIDIVRGKFDKHNDSGEISHFRALTSALSATVGLGNIAGVAIAINLGGPGAVFWMILTAIFGMSAKFCSCTLSQMYRKVNSDGSISGGPMYYLDIGLHEMGNFWGKIGKILAIMFALMVMGGAIGGGNMFQANQTAEAIISTFNLSSSANSIVGITLAILVGTVILGGIKRISIVTSRVVPLMVGLYMLASLFIICYHISELPNAILLIFKMAFADNAFFGGAIGVLIIGAQRAAFSNEAGLGSAAIVHAAAKTNEPVREGMVAMLGPFIDTIVVCTATALVVIITGTWNNPELVELTSNKGISLTFAAFGSTLPWFPYVLSVCIFLFAYSTMLSWCYYGERGWIYILDHFNGAGLKTVILFRITFVLFIYIGAVNNFSDVLDFTDAMILSMAFPNILGCAILAPKVLAKSKDYLRRHKNGEFISS